MKQHINANIKVLFALTLVHFTGDFYSSFINPLFPMFVEKIGLSLAQIGCIAGVSKILAFIVQPSVGYLADRYQTRSFIMAGLLLPVVFIPLTGITTGFWTLMLATALGSIGSSMFHPSVTGMVPLYSGNKAGFSMSVFNTGGTLAFGVGPLFITWYAGRFGLDAVPVTMTLGLVAIVYLFFTVPAPQSEGLQRLGFIGALRESLGSAWKVIALIWAVMFIRSVVGHSFLIFIPVMFVQKGFSVVSAGLVFSLFILAGTVTGLISGHVSDKIGFKPVFIFTHALIAPVLLLFLELEGNWIYLGAVISGAVVLATLPLGVVMAQKLAPKGRSMVASLMMGFVYGLGGLVVPVVGKLADIFSIYTVLFWISLVSILTMPLIFLFPNEVHNSGELP